VFGTYIRLSRSAGGLSLHIADWKSADTALADA
jgi:hypothetical protein